MSNRSRRAVDGSAARSGRAETTALHAGLEPADPTVEAFERRVAALEGGVAAVAVASGQAAQTLAILNLAEAGDNIVASRSLLGGANALFTHTLPRLGIRTRFVDIHDLRAVAAAIDHGTRAIYTETVGNLTLDAPDLDALSRLAHDFNLPLVVDSTFAPVLTRPIDHGADIVLHSATQWTEGHDTCVGGVIVDAGRFNWAATARFQRFFSDPEPAYHGMRFAEAFANVDGANIAFAVRLRVLLLRDIGASLSPFNAFLFLQGLETLPHRIDGGFGDVLTFGVRGGDVDDLCEDLDRALTTTVTSDGHRARIAGLQCAESAA